LIRTNRFRAAAAAVTIAGATAATMLIPASPAVAFSSGGLVLDLVVQSPAHLIAKGAAVGVPVDYTCSGVTSNASVTVAVTERVGGNIASGGNSVSDLTCTGEIQSVTIDVTASPGGRAFTKGVAFANADIFGCSGFLCGQETKNLTITIKS
jgi:hypothetical protein